MIEAEKPADMYLHVNPTRTGAFCNAEIRNQFHIDPDSQQMTSVPSE